jgi:hypothetical protein
MIDDDDFLPFVCGNKFILSWAYVASKLEQAAAATAAAGDDDIHVHTITTINQGQEPTFACKSFGHLSFH